MPAGRRQLEDLVAQYSQRLHARGWVANHDGNVTVRLAEDRFISTPTAVSKGAVTRDCLILVDGRGEVVSGTGKAFTELALHLHVYRRRRDVQAVLHAHPPTATGFAVAGVPLSTAMMPEPVVSLGAIPLVPYARPKTPEWTASMDPLLEDADALLLEHHGVLTVGPDLETAFLRMELVEHLARIQLAAQQVGGVREIPAGDVERLLESRTGAGLGAAGRERAAASDIGAHRRPDHAAAREPAVDERPRQAGAGVDTSEVRAIVLEEIGRTLRK